MSRRERHLRELADKIGAVIELNRHDHPRLGDGSPYGEAWGNRYAEVWLWDGRSARAYFTALHELGHIAHRHHTDIMRDWRWRILEAEAEAWDWAFQNAAEEPSEEVLDFARYALRTYVRDFGTSTAGPVYSAVSRRLNTRA